MKKLIAVGFITLISSLSTFAAQCYTTNVKPEFTSRTSIEFKAIESICFNEMSTTIDTYGRLNVVHEMELNNAPIKYQAPVYKAQVAADGTKTLKYTLEIFKNNPSFCDEETGNQIMVTTRFNAAGEFIDLEIDYAWAYYSWDNCHDTSPESIDYNFQRI